MRIVIRWRQQDGREASPALRRFRAVLSSAAETHYYRPWLDAARLLHPEKIRQLGSLSEALACVPRVELWWFLQHAGEFRNRRAVEAYRPQLQHPSDAPVRTAILEPGFEQTGNIRCFERGDFDGLLKFGPECLAGSVPTLLHVARGVRRGRMALPTIRHSVVAFADVRNGLMAEADRDTLWDAFQVPVFEQLRGLRGELLAAECETHAGLHLCARDAVIEFDASRPSPELLFTSLVDLARPAMRLATGWSPRIEEGSCVCGSGYPRLMDLAPVGRRRAMAG